MTDVKQIQQVHARSLQSFNAALTEENANYQRAAAVGDLDEMSRAAAAMAGLRASRRELDLMAHEAMTPSAPPPLAGGDELSRRDVDLARKYGLSAPELGIARNWTADADMSDEAKVQQYVSNRHRYRHAVATGEYRSDQGKVTR
jgi:hypothetical protein